MATIEGRPPETSSSSLGLRPRTRRPEPQHSRGVILDVSFPTIILHEEELLPGLTALCAGYELGKWRAEDLAKRLMDWLLEFCLTYSELESLSPQNATYLIRQAAGQVYQTEKFKNRGEFGELMLHAVLRQVYDTVPAVSKIYYKDNSNDTVKGFDAVHVVAYPDALELWLGEAKFYDDVNRAISDVVAELEVHTRQNYMRSEFVAIKNKIDNSWPHADRLKRLLHEHVSLDEIFDAVCIPVLLTYDSKVLARHTKQSDEYRREIEKEIRHYHSVFASKKLPSSVRIHLFLVPLNTKAILVHELDKVLRAWQQV